MSKMSLIITIVRKGWGSTVLGASVAAGSRGATVLFGRGAGVNETERIFGMAIEPEKEIILTVVPEEKVDRILEAIVTAADLEKPGHGLAFVLPVDRVVGIAHLLQQP
jgi:nitrogen regulatory protein PII